jgi:hypothetical protein
MWGVSQDLKTIEDPSHKQDRDDLIKSLEDAKGEAGKFTVKDPSFEKAADDFLKAVQGKDQVDSLKDKKQAFIDSAAKHTSIIDLRTYGDPDMKEENRKKNGQEMDAERETSKNLGVQYQNFSMNSKKFQTPEKLSNIVNAVNGELQKGNKVDIHCFHGTDRTGLVVQAVRASAEASQSKDNKLADPSEKYHELSKDLLQFGCDPATHREVFHSIDAYVHSLNGEKTQAASGAKVDDKHPASLAPGEAAQLKKSEDAFDIDFSSEMAKHLPKKEFVQNVIEDYKKTLSGDMEVEDPKTQTEYYKKLSAHFDALWTAAAK